MDEKLSRLEALFYAAVQDEPSAREKIANLLDSLDVSREEDRMKIDCLSEIAQRSVQYELEAINDIAAEGVSDAWYIMAFCEFYDLTGEGYLKFAAKYLMRCKDHEDAKRFAYDHGYAFSALQAC